VIAASLIQKNVNLGNQVDLRNEILALPNILSSATNGIKDVSIIETLGSLRARMITGQEITVDSSFNSWASDGSSYILRAEKGSLMSFTLPKDSSDTVLLNI
jgi:hypothetical protein